MSSFNKTFESLKNGKRVFGSNSAPRKSALNRPSQSAIRVTRFPAARTDTIFYTR